MSPGPAGATGTTGSPLRSAQSIDSPFRVLFVCTGSICRSPIAERLAKHSLAARLSPAESERIVVESAGTWGHEGSPMEPFAADVVREFGGDPSGFHGRELIDEHVAEADLVLTATRDHRAHVVSMGHASGLRTFTLKEFSRLIRALEHASVPVEDLADRGRFLVRAASALRGRLPAPDPEWDEVADPYGSPLNVFRNCAAEIDEALEPVLSVLIPGSKR